MDKVIWMNNQLSTGLRELLKNNFPSLEYGKDPDRPHYPGIEYFVCYECKNIIAFPLRTAK